MYDFSYDYIKPKYDKKVKLCYIDTDSFIAMYKQKIFTKILLQMLKQGQTLQIIRQIHPCLWEKIKKVIGLMNDELGGQIVKKFVLLQSKMYSYLKNNNDEGTIR